MSHKKTIASAAALAAAVIGTGAVNSVANAALNSAQHDFNGAQAKNDAISKKRMMRQQPN